LGVWCVRGHGAVTSMASVVTDFRIRTVNLLVGAITSVSSIETEI